MKDVNISKYNYDSTGIVAAVVLVAAVGFFSYMAVMA